MVEDKIGRAVLYPGSLATYVTKVKPDARDWDKLGHVGSSQQLKALLGHKQGVALDKLFHTQLRRYLRPGDSVPCLRSSPEKDIALALFFHSDQTFIEVEIRVSESRYRIETMATMGLSK